MSPAGGAEEDSSSVVIEVPLGLEALRAYCDDLERLYRINPYLEIQSWDPLGPDAVRVAWRNLSNDRADQLELRRERDSPDAFSVGFSHGIKRATRFVTEATDSGSRLTISDDYGGLSQAERERRIAEVDKSLVAWGWALHAYLRRERRFGGIALWRWALRRVWLPMRPAARRISALIVLVSLAEFLFFLLVALIYWIEHGRGT
jgi:hypothetical protein